MLKGSNESKEEEIYRKSEKNNIYAEWFKTYKITTDKNPAIVLNELAQIFKKTLTLRVVSTSTKLPNRQSPSLTNLSNTYEISMDNYSFELTGDSKKKIKQKLCLMFLEKLIGYNLSNRFLHCSHLFKNNINDNINYVGKLNEYISNKSNIEIIYDKSHTINNLLFCITATYKNHSTDETICGIGHDTKIKVAKQKAAQNLIKLLNLDG